MSSGVRGLGKRTHKEITAERRHKEAETIKDIGRSLPLSRYQVEQSNQTSLLRLTISFIKAREFMKTAGVDYRSLKGFSKEELLNFYGFVLLVDLSGNVLYATEKITEQLGPYLSDVVGEPASSLIHPEDVEQLKRVLSIGNLSAFNSTNNMFVVRMKTNLSGQVREGKQQFKNVFVTCYLKSFENTMRKSSENSPSESRLLVLLCRTEELIGFPEIVMGSYVDFESSLVSHIFTKMDSKGQWLLGYRSEDIIGQDPFLFRHPRDKPPQTIRKLAEYYLGRKLRTEGMLRFPRGRFLTAWGDWVWTQTDVFPLEMKGDRAIQCRARMCILERDDGIERSSEWRTKGTAFEEVHRYLKALNITQVSDVKEGVLAKAFHFIFKRALTAGNKGQLLSPPASLNPKQKSGVPYFEFDCNQDNPGSSSTTSSSGSMEGSPPQPPSVGGSAHSVGAATFDLYQGSPQMQNGTEVDQTRMDMFAEDYARTSSVWPRSATSDESRFSDLFPQPPLLPSAFSTLNTDVLTVNGASPHAPSYDSLSPLSHTSGMSHTSGVYSASPFHLSQNSPPQASPPQVSLYQPSESSFTPAPSPLSSSHSPSQAPSSSLVFQRPRLQHQGSVEAALDSFFN